MGRGRRRGRGWGRGRGERELSLYNQGVDNFNGSDGCRGKCARRSRMVRSRKRGRLRSILRVGRTWERRRMLRMLRVRSVISTSQTGTTWRASTT